MKTVVTHSGSFHSDDVFSIAAFQLLFGVDQVQVVRTREDKVIESGDYVVDVGHVYDHDSCRYDHHQNGAPVRENGIPYAGFGLMWKHYGASICGSEEVAAMIEEKLCLPIDAGDNGVTIYELKDADIRPYEIYNIIGSFRPIENSPEAYDAGFLKAAEFARGQLERVIAHGHESVRLQEIAKEYYEKATDKRIMVLNESLPEGYFIDYEEVKGVVYPSVDMHRGEIWKVAPVPTGLDSFDKRATFPKAWLGLRDDELAEVSDIEDAIFCHKGGFRFVAASREGALKATEFLE